MTSIYREVCKRLGRDESVLYIELSDRSQHIIQHYQRTLNRSHRRDSRLYIETLINACLSNLAGANGDREATQRTRIEL